MRNPDDEDEDVSPRVVVGWIVGGIVGGFVGGSVGIVIHEAIGGILFIGGVVVGSSVGGRIVGRFGKR